MIIKEISFDHWEAVHGISLSKKSDYLLSLESIVYPKFVIECIQLFTLGYECKLITTLFKNLMIESTENITVYHGKDNFYSLCTSLDKRVGMRFATSYQKLYEIIIEKGDKFLPLYKYSSCPIEQEIYLGDKHKKNVSQNF